MNYEVGIVGGGIHGVSAAFHLARRGVRTVLLERGGPASGPTGRSSAICRAFYTNRFLAACARDSIQAFRTFGELTGGRTAEYHETGALFLHARGDAPAVRASVAMLRSLDIRIESLTTGEIARRQPRMALDGVEIGVWEERAGYADPASTTRGLYESALESGLAGRLGVRVERIDPASGGGGALVTTDGVRFGCERILIAAGPWTRTLAAQVFVDLPLTVERHFVTTFEWGRSQAVPFVFADVPGGYYFKPDGAAVFLLGPLTAEPPADPDDFPQNVTTDEIAELGSRMLRRIPDLAEARSRGGWASLYDVSPDWQPVIGEIRPGIFVDAGTSGHGFKLAPALGRHVADMVLGHAHPDLAQFAPSRFAAHAELSAGFGEARILG